jgi:superfamily II DNA helicase RecQ
MSPERLLEKDGAMKSMLRNPEIRRRLKYLIIDECHYMITSGKSFRTEYANIGDIRAFLDTFEDTQGDSQRIPLGLFTATATPDRLDAIKKKMKIKEGQHLRIKRSSNRANLFYSTVRCTSGRTICVSEKRRILNSHPLIACQEDLLWLIPQGTMDTNIDGIPPTIIYVNQKQVGLDICNALQRVL